MRLDRGGVVIALTIIAVLGMTAAPVVGTVGDGDITDDYQFTEYDATNEMPNPYINASMTKASHDMSEGSSDGAMEGYEDDNGDWVDPADSFYVVNTSGDTDTGENVNPYSFKPGHIVDESFTEFPDKSGRTWSNSSRWTVNQNANNITISNTTVASDADAVQFDSTGVSASVQGAIIYSAKYNAWDSELDSDETKRYLQWASDVDTLQGDVTVQIRVYDESGNYKQLVMNDSRSFQNNVTVVANGTDDVVKQVSLDALTTSGSSFDNIENVTIRAVADSGTSNLDSQFSLSWLDLRRKGKVDLGEETVQDGDGDYTNTNTTYNATNSISINSMDTLDTEFDDATINDVSFKIRADAANLDTEGEGDDYVVYQQDASDYPSFDHVLNASYRLEIPSQIDLSYTDPTVDMVQKYPSSRYEVLDIAEGPSADNLSQASGSDVTGSLASKGDQIELDGSASSGTEYVVTYELKVTQDEWDNDILAAPDDDDGAAPPPEDEQSFFGGLFDWMFGTISGLAVTVAGSFGIWRWWKGRGA